MNGLLNGLLWIVVVIATFALGYYVGKRSSWLTPAFSSKESAIAFGCFAVILVSVLLIYGSRLFQ